MKVTVYVNNTILCWRRSGPRAVAAVMEVEEDLALHMPELDLDATHLVLSVRLRTRPGISVATHVLLSYLDLLALIVDNNNLLTLSSCFVQ